ncbi:unnamed protein product [Allacma fusca]|uniref:Uncharacterized protein n=1 Tax=Allacma fusca TaxID=39272 RepID=A0A8J2NRE0_9HEXA|nr:unnamed protein product [Allacma fusca]
MPATVIVVPLQHIRAKKYILTPLASSTLVSRLCPNVLIVWSVFLMNKYQVPRVLTNIVRNETIPLLKDQETKQFQ